MSTTPGIEPSGEAANECPVFHHHDASVLGDDLYDLYDRMRPEGVSWSPGSGGYWVVTGYDDVRSVLKDHVTFSSAQGAFLPDLGYRFLGLEQDPPEHGPFRKLYTAAVGRSAAVAREDALREMIARVVDEFAAAGGGDAREEISEKVPVEAVALVFGLSPAAASRVRELTTEAWKRMSTDPQAMVPLVTVLLDEVADRRETPQDDFLTALTTAEVDGRPLTEDEIGNFLVGEW